MSINVNKMSKQDQAPAATEKAASEAQAYAAPAVFVIGRSGELLQGSGRHKFDDTGSRGFVVDSL